MPIHKEFFGEHRPAWTAVGSPALLSSTAPVEMRVIAVIGSGKASRVVYEDPPPASAADTDTATAIDDPSSAPTEEPKPASSSLGLQLELAVPHAPTPLPSGGETHLAYELHLTSFDRDDIALRGIEVMAADETAARPLAAFEGEELISILRPIGAAGATESRDPRAVTALDGRTQIAQRYAIDYVQLGDDGGTFSGDRGDNASYHAYGDEVLAVADGTVAAVKNGIPENIPGPSSRAVPITRETIGGNYVVLDPGDGLFAFYAHLQPGSLRVREGDRVRRGQVLALLGNSGNSTEPHLHFHLADGPSPLAAEGVPFVIDEYSTLDSNGDPERRTAELPLENARVDF